MIQTNNMKRSVLAVRISASRCRLITSNNSSKLCTSCPNSSVQEEEIMATLLGSESPCTGGKRRNCTSNIVTKFTASKITGQGFSRGTQVRQTMHVSAVETSECWSTETGDLRLESSLKTKTLVRETWLEMHGSRPPVSFGFTASCNLTCFL